MSGYLYSPRLISDLILVLISSIPTVAAFPLRSAPRDSQSILLISNGMFIDGNRPSFFHKRLCKAAARCRDGLLFSTDPLFTT